MTVMKPGRRADAVARGGRPGFTLIELLIVVTVIVIIISIALPNLLASKLNANETSSIQTLRTISAAQAQFKTRNAVDSDSDGVGEYGYLAEMSGLVLPRSGGAAIQPPSLSGAFRVFNNGRVNRSGYYFRLLLPASDGRGIAEAAGGGFDPGDPPDPDLSETVWACYAWPSNEQITGLRIFFINQAGDVIQSDNTGTLQMYSGDRGPEPGAAFTSGAIDKITGVLAIGTTGNDGGVWRNLN